MSNKHGRAPKLELRARRDLKPKVESNIAVSLQYLTRNKRYNFEVFGAKDFRKKGQALEQFLEFLRRLTAKTRLEISLLSKTDDCGFEQIPFWQVEFEPCGTKLGRDTKICDFRFGDNETGGDYRLLGFFEVDRPVLNIIGFDFKYSAYEH